MDETRIEIGPSTATGAVCHMPEGLEPMRVIQVGVEAEDLTEDSLDITEKRFREAGCFANPVTTSECREWSSEAGGTHSNWSGRAGCV